MEDTSSTDQLHRQNNTKYLNQEGVIRRACPVILDAHTVSHQATFGERNAGRAVLGKASHPSESSAPGTAAMTEHSTDQRARSPLGDRLPKGHGELVLYLDYDGVLHNENVYWHPKRGAYPGPPGFTLFEHAPLLHELLTPYPEVGIVLSTSWVRLYGCTKTAKRLPQGLRARVLGATFHSQMDEAAFAARPRGQQVLDDVARRRPRGWLALDDTDEGWPPEVRDRVLLTDERLGIAAAGMPERIAAALDRLCAFKAP